jgi:hypothetical protein
MLDVASAPTPEQRRPSVTGIKKLALAALAVLAFPWSAQAGGFRLGIGIGVPYYPYYRPYYYDPYYRPVVVVAPPPGVVYVAPPPGTVYVAPAAPTYVQPAPAPAQPLPPPRLVPPPGN